MTGGADAVQVRDGGEDGRPARGVQANSGGDLRDALDDFKKLKSRYESLADDDRIREQPALVSRYYDIVTPFYEYGWGSSFHFAPRRPGEKLKDALLRQEEGIGAILRLEAGMAVADIGCGIGGPLIAIARSTGAGMTGINWNAHQIARGEKLLRKAGLDGSCRFLLANFMDIPLEDGSFDAVYSLEALCHAPDTRRAFEELYRLLRPGGELAAVDWCLTEAFDESDAQHRDALDRLEMANATPDLLTTGQQVEAVRASGFEIVTAVDQQVTEGDPRTPWFMALQGRDISLSSLARIPAGRRVTAAVTRAAERLRIAPPGTGEAAGLLNVAADSLVEAGELGIFTPSFLVHARKPGGNPGAGTPPGSSHPPARP